MIIKAVNDMSAEKRNFYFARNKDGYVCAYDKNTHKCIGVMESTGDIPLSEEKRKEYSAQLDPKYENKNT